MANKEHTVAGAPDRQRNPEHRWPAVIAVLLGIVLYGALPNELVLGTKYVVPALELLLLIPLIAVNPSRFRRETRWSRVLSLTLVGIIAAANLFSLGLLINALLSGQAQDGKQLLLAAFQVWLTNIIVFGLGYWELDRGGPVKRSLLPRDELPPADFRFSQDENDDAVVEVAVSSSGKSDWTPSLTDYLYVSLTNSTAFSPTDTMPLSTRAKLMMGTQCVAALVTSVLVIARAVSAIK
jgi:hypothetical protein